MGFTEHKTGFQLTFPVNDSHDSEGFYVGHVPETYLGRCWEQPGCNKMMESSGKGKEVEEFMTVSASEFYVFLYLFVT